MCVPPLGAGGGAGEAALGGVAFGAGVEVTLSCASSNRCRSARVAGLGFTTPGWPETSLAFGMSEGRSASSGTGASGAFAGPFPGATAPDDVGEGEGVEFWLLSVPGLHSKRVTVFIIKRYHRLHRQIRAIRC